MATVYATSAFVVALSPGSIFYFHVFGLLHVSKRIA